MGINDCRRELVLLICFGSLSISGCMVVLRSISKAGVFLNRESNVMPILIRGASRRIYSRWDPLFVGTWCWLIVRVAFERDWFRTLSQGFVGHRCDRAIGSTLENALGRFWCQINEGCWERSTNTGQDFRWIESSDQLLHVVWTNGFLTFLQEKSIEITDGGCFGDRLSRRIDFVGRYRIRNRWCSATEQSASTTRTGKLLCTSDIDE